MRHLGRRLPSALVCHRLCNWIAGFYFLRAGWNIHGPELLVDILPLYPVTGPVIRIFWVFPEENREDRLVVQVRQHGANRAVRERDVPCYFPAERGADIRVQPRRKGEGGHAELFRSPGEVEGEPCARVFPGDLREDVPDGLVHGREDQLPREGDGERFGDLLHGVDCMPDCKPLFLDLGIGRESVRLAVRKDVRVGDDGERAEDGRVRGMYVFAGTDDVDVFARWHGEVSGRGGLNCCLFILFGLF